MKSDPISYKSRTLSAIFLVIVGYLGFNVADLCSKILQDHYSIYQVLGTSSLLGLIITATWLKTKHGWSAFFPSNIKLHIVRAFLVLGTAYFMVASLKTLPLADFYGIIFIMPFMVMMMAVLLLKEHVGWRRWTAAAVAFLGVLIIAGPQFNNIGQGIIFAFMGAFFAAANIIALRKIGHGLPLALYGIYPFTLLIVFSMIGLIATDSYVPVRIEDVPMFLTHGPSVVFAMICMSTGYAKAPETAIVAPFNYTQIIWGILFGWIFFQNLPTTTTWAGLSLVVLAGLYSLWREYKISHHL
jgi:drug/metabolite transporter (DMT)-like permease